MSTKYKHPKEVPLQVIVARLRELATAITKGRDSQEREFTMRVPAECDRDADIVINEAANRIGALQARAAVSAPEGWRPIWTAPKDRSVILGVDAECGAVYIGRQRFGYLGEPSQDTYAWRCDSSGRFSSPTHWMEAPKGPAKSNRGVPYGT